MRTIVYDTIMLKSDGKRFTPIRLITNDARDISEKSGNSGKYVCTKKLWRIFCNQLAVTEEQLKNCITAIRVSENASNYLWYRPNGKQITTSGLAMWMQCQLNSACTVDELLKLNPGLKITARFLTRTRTEEKWQTQKKAQISTSADFEKWIQEVKDESEKMKENGIRIANVISFSEEKLNKPLFSGRDTPLEFVLHSRKHGYLRTASDVSEEWTRNPKESMIFTPETYAELIAAREGIENDAVKTALISNRTNIEEPFNVVIQSTLGFFKIRHGKRFEFTDNPDEAMHFPNVKEAKRTIRRFNSVFVADFRVTEI